MKRYVFPLFILSIAWVHAASADADRLSLVDAVSLAEKNSLPLRASEANFSAAENNANAAKSANLLPRLSIEGSYKYQTEVPKVTVGSNTIPMGDNYTYSIGPTLSYTLWDSGLKRNQARGYESLADAKAAQRDLTLSQLTLATKIAYVQSTLASEILKNSIQAASLSLTQNKDIRVRYRNGSSSKLDALNSDSEVLSYNLKVKQAESDWQSSVADLAYLVGNRSFRPADLESLDELSSRLKEARPIENLESHPLVLVQTHLGKAADFQADAQRALYWPTLNLQLRSSFDYPNGATLEQVQQNSISLGLSWTMFDFGVTKNQVASKRAEAEAASFQREDTLIALKRDEAKARAKIQSLLEQVNEAKASVNKQQELARLNFSTYRYGKISYSEVQNANLRLLDSQTRLASLQAQYLVQIFNLEYFSKRE